MTAKWTAGPTLAFGRIGRLAIAAILVLGGYATGVHRGTLASSVAVWSRLPQAAQLPPARSQFGMTIDANGAVYVFGGRGPDGALADFWRLRRADRSWQQLPNPLVPPLIEPHLAADAAGNVFEFGGINPAGANHFTGDGHSYGLYEYVAAQGSWLDLTTRDTHPEADWPQGREDHGFAYDPTSGAFFLFAGEGSGNASLNDMWRYDERTGRWSQVHQRFATPGGIDAREIYNISPDGHGGLYLFGGAYPFNARGQRAPWKYLNDLWRFDIATSTWRLIAGRANAYDPTMPLPRHYYGQACDAQGNFYILGGYVSDTDNPPFFADDQSDSYAQIVVFNLPDAPTGNIMYALDDFWQYNIASHGWVDLSYALGDLQNAPFIPYVMVADPTVPRLLIFAGYYTNGDGELQAGANLRSYPLPAIPVARSTATATQRPGLAASTSTPSSTPRRTAHAGPTRAGTATPDVPAWPTPTTGP